MKAIRWKSISVMSLAFAALSGCGGGGGGGGGGSTVVSQAWYNVYGNYCGSTPSPGCDFYQNGTKINYASDPYVVSLTYGSYVYTDVYGYTQSYRGYAYSSPDGILYDQYGNALNSANHHGKDTVTNAAAAEKAAIHGAANALAAKYGLDADVSISVANALNDWAVIGKSRKRTDADVAAFTKRLTGLNVGEVSAAIEAYAKGDTGKVDEAISKVASNWSTNPDTMKQILRDWFQNQK